MWPTAHRARASAASSTTAVGQSCHPARHRASSRADRQLFLFRAAVCDAIQQPTTWRRHEGRALEDAARQRASANCHTRAKHPGRPARGDSQAETEPLSGAGCADRASAERPPVAAARVLAARARRQCVSEAPPLVSTGQSYNGVPTAEPATWPWFVPWLTTKTLELDPPARVRRSERGVLRTDACVSRQENKAARAGTAVHSEALSPLSIYLGSACPQASACPPPSVDFLSHLDCGVQG